MLTLDWKRFATSSSLFSVRYQRWYVYYVNVQCASQQPTAPDRSRSGRMRRREVGFKRTPSPRARTSRASERRWRSTFYKIYINHHGVTPLPAPCNKPTRTQHTNAHIRSPTLTDICRDSNRQPRTQALIDTDRQRPTQVHTDTRRQTPTSRNIHVPNHIGTD